MRINKVLFFLKRIGTFSLLIMVFSILISSCVSQRDLEYLRVKDRSDKVIQSFDEPRITDYKLQINDELQIDIKSLDDPSTNVFQQISPEISGYTTPFSASLSAYMVDKTGYIQLPILGNIYVREKTITEVIALLQDSLNQVLSYPQVKVKLVNRYVSVFGEVRNPGHFNFTQEKLTVYNALSMAGDITTYGARNRVVLVRNENGKNSRINLDLSTSDIMASEYYYLRPNDMIYVRPMRKRFLGFNEFPWQLLLTSVSTGVLLYTVFGQ